MGRSLAQGALSSLWKALPTWGKQRPDTFHVSLPLGRPCHHCGLSPARGWVSFWLLQSLVGASASRGQDSGRVEAERRSRLGARPSRAEGAPVHRPEASWLGAGRRSLDIRLLSARDLTWTRAGCNPAAAPTGHGRSLTFGVWTVALPRRLNTCDVLRAVPSRFTHASGQSHYYRPGAVMPSETQTKEGTGPLGMLVPRDAHLLMVGHRATGNDQCGRNRAAGQPALG